MATIQAPKKIVHESAMDPVKSVDLFDGNRTNFYGGMYCVAAGILPSEVETYWQEYVQALNNPLPAHTA